MFTEVITPELALQEANTYADKKNLLPKRRAMLQPAVDTLAEAIQYGVCAIMDDGSISHILVTPVLSMERIVYKPRLKPLDVKNELAKVKMDSVAERTGVYLKLLTGLTVTEVNSLEPTDSGIAEAISLFFW